MFKVTIDNKIIDVKLTRRHFIFLKVDGYDVYIDSGAETPITSLPDDLREPGQLENLVRYGISTNDIELNIKSLPNIAPFGGSPKPATYHGKMVVCRSKELIPGSGEGWITFNISRKLQLEDFVYALKVKNRKV